MVIMALTIGAISAAIYDIIKSGLTTIAKKDFEEIYNNALDETVSKFKNVEYIHLDVLFESDIFKKEVEKIKTGEIEINDTILIKEFEKVLDKENLDIKASEVIEYFFNYIKSEAEKIPDVREFLELTYLKDIKEKQEKLVDTTKSISKDVKKMLKKYESLRSNKIEDIISQNKNNIPKLFNDLKNIIKASDTDPYYKLHANIDDKGIKLSYIPRKENVPPLKLSMTIRLDKKDGKIMTMNEMIEQIKKTREEIIIKSEDIVDIKAFMGDKSLLPKNYKPNHIKIKPKPIDPIPCKIEILGSKHSFDYVLLKPTFINDNKIIISSENRNLPFKFVFEIIKDKDIKFNFSLDYKTASLKQAFQFERFSKDFSEIGKIKVKDLKQNVYVLEGKNGLEIYDENKTFWLNILEALLFIQEKTSQKFSIPEQVSPSDANTIFKTKMLLENKAVEQPIKEATIQILKKEFKTFLNKIPEDETLKDVKVNGEMKVSLLNKEISLGKFVQTLPDMKLKNSKIELEEIAKKWDADKIPVKLVPIKEKNITIMLETS